MVRPRRVDIEQPIPFRPRAGQTERVRRLAETLGESIQETLRLVLEAGLAKYEAKARRRGQK